MKGGSSMNGNEVRSYLLSPEELEELWARLGKPGEVAPGIKAPKKRNKSLAHRPENPKE